MLREAPRGDELQQFVAHALALGDHLVPGADALGVRALLEVDAVRNLPSGRTYVYVDPLGANGFIPTGELSGIYG